MHTLLVYDEIGNILFSETGRNPTSLVGTAVIEIPDGKEVSHVDVNTGEVFLKDIEPVKTVTDLEEELEAKDDYIALLCMADAEV